jgi:hypothetical protein
MDRRTSVRARVFLALSASAAAALTVYAFAAPFEVPH